MFKSINEEVAINLVSTPSNRSAVPVSVTWHDREYAIQKIGLHYTYKTGNKLFHVFCVSSETTNFKLVLDTGSLICMLEEVYDEVSEAA